jgi:hypothetical protein
MRLGTQVHGICLRLVGGDVQRSLCEGLRALSIAIWEQLGDGASVNIQPSETTLTDNLLINLATQFRDRVAARRTTQRQERTTGTDFEIRFIERDRFVQLRLQAKRLDVHRQRYWDFSKREKAIQQAKTLLIHSQRWPSLYCFYNHFDTRTLPHLRMAEPMTWGVALADANKVLGVLESGSAHRDLIELQAPWHELVCRDGDEAPDLLRKVIQFLSILAADRWSDMQPQEGSPEANLNWMNQINQVPDSELIARLLIGRPGDL